MAYTTQTEIEARTGYSNADFKQAGVAMTAEQWTAECTRLIAEVTNLIDRYCRRGSFESTAYTEYHDGDGATGDDGALREGDRIFYPREQPVIAVTSVSEDVGGKTAVPAWTVRTARSSEAAGDYDVIVKGPLTRVRFHANVPRQGIGTVKIVYTAGYAAGSPALDAVRGIALHMIATLLEIKKKRQEAIAARTVATRDAADMVPVTDPRVFSRDVQERLAPYRRNATGGRMWR